MVAVVVMVVVVRNGEGEGEGEGAAELKQASRELPGLLLSAVIMLKRSRPGDVTSVLPSEEAKGSLGRGRTVT